MAKQFLKSSVMRKVAMALSGIFLIMFLVLHVTLNSVSVFSAPLFNSISHFMSYNPLVQYIGQPILAFGVVFHFVMGFVLELQNRKARPIPYAFSRGSANSSWASRNMIISGLVILSFLFLHWYDFWFQELNYKYFEVRTPDSERYYSDLVHKFTSPVRTLLYCGAFVLLGFHLWHGFASSMQSVGFNNKYSRSLVKFGKYFAVAVPFCFVFMALFHHFRGL
jgi:succinate dehydrogenase / fumarate reductase cytochrome b subunit